MGRRLGVMGGTFDPIHYGHLVTAEEALVQFALDEVVFVPTGQPWMKQEREVSPAEDRYLMTVIATASNPRFRVSRIEVDREGPTYTVDTLRALGCGEPGRGAVLHHRRRRDARDLRVEGPGRCPVARALHRRDPARLRPRARSRRRTRRRASERQRDAHPGARDQLDRRARARRTTAARSATSCPKASKSYIEKAALYR